MYQKYLLQSKLLDSYKTIEQLKIQLDRHQMEMGQLQGYIDRLEHELHYYKNAAVRLQNQVKFLQARPVQQQTTFSRPPSAPENITSNIPKKYTPKTPKKPRSSLIQKTLKANKKKSEKKDNKDTTKIKNILTYLENK